MLFSHHSHSLLHEYVSDQNLQLKQETRWSWKKNPGDCSDRLMGLLLPLFCSSSRALIHLAEQSESYYSHRWALLPIQHAQLAPKNPPTRANNGRRVPTVQESPQKKMILNTKWWLTICTTFIKTNTLTKPNCWRVKMTSLHFDSDVKVRSSPRCLSPPPCWWGLLWIKALCVFGVSGFSGPMADAASQISLVHTTYKQARKRGERSQLIILSSPCLTASKQHPGSLTLS